MPPGYPGGSPPPAAAAPGAPGARPPGGPGGSPPGGPGGGGGGSDRPADFRTTFGAVNAFLDAVKAKDPARLKEATALHAGQPSETRPQNKKIFEAILEESLSPDDLDELAKKLDGYQVSGSNDATSSGRLGITLHKSGAGGSFLQRTITVRKEKAGWKVVDISGEGKLESMNGGGGGGGGMRGRRR
ncbi:MAG: hypothetical protein P4L84_20815 [Isosphaeraceae bacterium]|nr:hypothetical protein [Isosphaeraceae bacterium]